MIRKSRRSWLDEARQPGSCSKPEWTIGTSPEIGAHGFSLLELMLTVSVLAIATLAAALIVVPVARESRLRREVETANVAAKRVLERIQSTPFTSILSTYPQGHVETVPGLNSSALTIQYADPAADPLDIRLDLVWVSPEAGSITRTFYTLRTE